MHSSKMLASPAPFVPTGNVVAFPPPRQGGQLTWRDRIALHEARDRLAAAGCRYAAHPEETEDGQHSDVVRLFQGEESWASWCLVRRGAAIHAWRCANGNDLGRFNTMSEALAAILAAPAYAVPRRRSRARD